jgi:hypothetical protein
MQPIVPTLTLRVLVLAINQLLRATERFEGSAIRSIFLERFGRNSYKGVTDFFAS